MSTRCQISALLGDDLAGCIYVHYDGYPEGVGTVLQNHYTDTDKISALIALGDCSSIGKSIEECDPYSQYPDEILDDIAPTYANTPEMAAEQHYRGDEIYLYIWNGNSWETKLLY